MTAPVTTALDLDRLLPMRDVCRAVGATKSTIYRWMDDDMLPRPIKIGKRRVVWKQSEIANWQDEKTRETRGE
jgi:prophage regulatory protein